MLTENIKTVNQFMLLQWTLIQLIPYVTATTIKMNDPAYSTANFYPWQTAYLCITNFVLFAFYLVATINIVDDCF